MRNRFVPALKLVANLFEIIVGLDAKIFVLVFQHIVLALVVFAGGSHGVEVIDKLPDLLALHSPLPLTQPAVGPYDSHPWEEPS